MSMHLRLSLPKLAMRLGLLILVLHLHLIIITCVLVNKSFLLSSRNVVLRNWVWKISATLACPSKALALENYHGFPLSHRQKQEFSDGIGHLSRMLFGIAMNEDVEELRDRYNHLALLASAHNKAIRFNSKHIGRLEQHVHDISSYTATLRLSLNNVLTTIK